MPLGRILFAALVLVLLLLVVLGAAWGSFYGAVDSENCWVAVPYEWRRYKQRPDYEYYGMPGMDPQIGQEDDGSFAELYVLSVLAVAASAAGCALAAKTWWGSRSLASYVTGPYHLYTKSLCTYFITALLVNFVNMVCFAEIRCNHHNLGSFWSYSLVGRVSVATSSSHWAKTLYLTANFCGGFFTNVLLELVLLLRVSMMQGATDPCRGCVQCMKWFIIVQLVLFLFGGTPYVIISFRNLVEEGIEEDEGEAKSMGFRVFAGVFGLVHVVTSVVLVVLFVRPFCAGANSAGNMRVILKVSIASSIAVVSTLLAYGNLGLMFANAYHLLAVDSIINDICLITVSFSDPTQDAENAGKSQEPNPVPAQQMGNANI